MSNDIFSTFYQYKNHKELFLDRPERAYLQYKKFRLNLISGERTNQGVEVFFSDLKKIKTSYYYEKPIVVHLLYELGYSCVGIESRQDENVPLAIYIEYNRAQTSEVNVNKETALKFESLKKVHFEAYHSKFQRVYESLLDGETYQLNLTLPFYLRPNKNLSPREYINRLWSDSLKVGAYAHATYIGSLDKLFMSNSPECLFQIIDGKKILTMPIKGTQKIEGEDWKKSWRDLKNSEKNQAELYMITDLMRNDLTKLTGLPSQVTFKKYPLYVPGLIHQFSVVESKIDQGITLDEVVKCLFPGGSITGAPKKNTMRLISEIEDYRRGFYCGSTILIYKRTKTASINIRSAEVDYSQNEIKYGAGGGITLQSQAFAEFEETLDKLKSFLMLVK